MGNEQKLIKEIRNGNKEAFSLLVMDLLPAAYKTAFLILKSKEHAEDALQLALEGAYISIMKNRNMTHFKAWFYRLVYSRAIDIYRKNSRIVQLERRGSDEAENKTAESAQLAAIHKENKAEMLEFIMKLNNEQSLPIYLHYYEDLPVKDISLILNENVNTIKTRLKRGRQKLAEMLSERDFYIQEVRANEL